MRKVMNKKSIKFVAMMLTISFVSMTLQSIFSFTAFAATLNDPYSYENCVNGMATFTEKSKNTFAEYLNTHFQSEKLNSELVDQAIDAYKSFRRNIYDELDKYKLGSLESSEQYKALDECIRLTEKSVLEAKDIFKNHFNTTAVFKKSTILLDKYKGINKKLGDLNFVISQIVGAFSTFNNKIMCFISNCLTTN